MITLSYPAPKVDAADPITLNIGWFVLQQLFGIGWAAEAESRNEYFESREWYQFLEMYESEANIYMCPVDDFEGDYSQFQVGTLDGVDYVFYNVNKIVMERFEDAYNESIIYGPGFLEHIKNCVPIADTLNEFYSARACLSIKEPGLINSGGSFSDIQPTPYLETPFDWSERFNYDDNTELFIPTSCGNPAHAPILPKLDNGEVSSLGNWLKSKVSNYLNDYSIVQQQPDVRDAILKYGKLTLTKQNLLTLLELFESEFGIIGGSKEVHHLDFSDKGKMFFEQSPIEKGLNGDFTNSYGTEYIQVPINFLSSGIWLQVYSGGGPFPLKISNKAWYVKSQIMPSDRENYNPTEIQYQMHDSSGPISLVNYIQWTGFNYANLRNLRYAIVSNYLHQDTSDDLGIALAFDALASSTNHRHYFHKLVPTRTSSETGLGLGYDEIAADGRVGLYASLTNPFADDDINIRDRRNEIEELLKDLDDEDEVDILPQVGNDGLVEPYPIPRDIPVDKVIDTSIPKVEDVELDIPMPEIDDIEMNLPDLDLSNVVVTKFPLSIPFDVYHMVNLFTAEPKAPVFQIPFKLESIGLDETLVLDLSQYKIVANVFGALFYISFIVTLIYLTNTLIGRN